MPWTRSHLFGGALFLRQHVSGNLQRISPLAVDLRVGF
jgi:hypothetical protein